MVHWSNPLHPVFDRNSLAIHPRKRNGLLFWHEPAILMYDAQRTEHVMARIRRSRVMVFPLDIGRCLVLVVKPSAHRIAGSASLASPPTRNQSASVHGPAIVRDQPG